MRGMSNIQKAPCARAKFERETCILFNEADPAASVFTCNQALARKLKSFAEEYEGFRFIKEDTELGEYFFEVPKRYVTIRRPVFMSEEQREASAKRLASYRTPS